MSVNVKLYCGDNRVSLRRLIDEGVRVHSVVTDPPYGLVSITKRFDKVSADDGTKTSERIRSRSDGFGRVAAGGFMGKVWDGTGIERDPEFWRLIWEILLPGGYVFAFSGSRTGHWQACAMEQAGFIMHPMHGWVFGSGFPKAHAADKAIDKMGGADRLKFVSDEWRTLASAIRKCRKDAGFTSAQIAGHFPEYRAVTANWERLDDGNRIPTETAYDRLIELIALPDKWRTLVKAADLRETVGTSTDRREDGTVYGLGHSGELKRSTTPEAAAWEGWAYGTQAQKPALEPIYLGQKPFSEKTGAANLLKHGVGAVNIDGCRVPAAAGDEPVSWVTPRGGIWKTDADADADLIVTGKGRHPANLILDGSPEVVALFPESKSTGGQASLGAFRNGDVYGKGKDVRVKRDPGFGDSGSAARFFHQFPPDTDPVIYQSKAGKEDRAGSKHPTVKPVALMQYLIRHITPPGGTVLDPFAGSGTTAEAAKREGFDCILMEAEDEYVEFLRHRFTGDFFCNVEVHDASRGA